MNLGNKILVMFILGIALFITPAFADGNLTVSGASLAPSYINTKTVTDMLNLSLNVTPHENSYNITLSFISFAIVGNATVADISSVHMVNASGSVIGSNTTNSSSTKFRVNIPGGLFINSSTNATVVIEINLSSSAYGKTNVSVNISSVSDIGNTSVGGNITITGGSVASGTSDIRDVHATASMSPDYVDTNVANQSVTYTITPTGNDNFTVINITIPVGYSIVNVTYISDDGVTLRNSTYQTPDLSVGFLPGNYYLGLNYTAGYNGTVIINFTIDTNSSAVTHAFNSTVTGSNMAGIAADVSAAATNLITKVLINLASLTVIKSTAYLNGTDYWEFEFALNFTANVTGLLQFEMSNWTDSSGNSIALTSGSTNRATLRDSTDASNIIDVKNAYNITTGVSLTGTEGNTKSVRLRMTIPSGTESSSSWWATYNMLFRSTP